MRAGVVLAGPHGKKNRARGPVSEVSHPVAGAILLDDGAVLPES